MPRLRASASTPNPVATIRCRYTAPSDHNDGLPSSHAFSVLFEAGATTSASALVAFWLRERRTPELLIDLARSHRELAREITIMARPLLSAVIEEDEPAIENGLAEEERSERALDRAYWTPLKRELEELRHA